MSYQDILYGTPTMIAALKELPPRPTFLRDRYFPSAPSDVFGSDKVLMDIKDGSTKIAPVVAPRKKGIVVEREGYVTKELAPPLIAPKRKLTFDDINKRGFGEALFSNLTPQQREAQILANDLVELSSLIDGREEYIAAQALLNNGYTLKQFVDEYGTNNYEEYELMFYTGSNPALFTPSNKWDSSTSYDIYGDLVAMCKLLTKRGLPVEDLVMSSDVAEVILNNQSIQKILDNRRINVGDVTPIALPDGAARVAVLNVSGHNINLISYDSQYTDETGTTESYMGEGNVVLTAPGAGRTLYGAVTQMEQADHAFHTYAGARIPRYMANEEEDVRTLRVSARPLLVPNNITPWIKANVLTAN